MNIFCCNCNKEVNTILTTGEEIYPHREDLYKLNFYKCSCCGNFVGCHKNYNKFPKPLGVIASKEIKEKRIEIHNIIDPIFISGKIERKKIYKLLSNSLGYSYHTANIKTIEEANKVIRIIRIIKEAQSKQQQ